MSERRTWKREPREYHGTWLEPLVVCGTRRSRLSDVIERSEVVAAHRELVEASDAVRHLLAVENLTQDKIDEARGRLARAYERVQTADGEMLRV